MPKRDSRALFSHSIDAALDGISDPIFVKDLSGRYLFANGAGARLVGRSLEEILGQDDEALLGSAAARALRALDQHVIAQRVAATLEQCLALRDSEEMYEFSNSPYRDSDGSIIGIVSILRRLPASRQRYEQLQATNRQLMTMLQTVADAVFLLAVEPDGGYRFESINPAFTKCTGLAAENVVGQRLEQVIPEHSRSLALANCRLAIDRKEVVRWEETVTFPAGTIVGEVSITPIYSTAGTCTHLVGSVLDVTERKRIDNALLKSESRYRQLVENAPYCIHELDAAGRFLSMNRAGLRMMGLDDASCIIGESYLDAVSERDRPRIAQLFQCAVAGAACSFEFTAVNGRRFSSNFVPLTDGTFMGITTDITDRKLAEESLRGSERKFRELADAIPQIVWVARPDGALTHLNLKASEYTGVHTTELTGWSWERSVHPDDLAHTLQEWTATLRTGIPRDIELRLRRADGVYRWHISRVVPVRNAEGAIDVWYGTSTDIEDLKAAQQAYLDSERRFRNMLDFYPAAVYVKDIAGRYLYVNRHAVDETGIPHSDWLNKTVYELFPTALACQFDRNDQIVIQTKRVRQFEEEMFLPGGRRITLFTVQYPLFSAQGELYAICGISTNISDRRAAEEERDRLWNDSLDPLCVAGFDGRFKLVSPAWTRTVGWSEQELLQRPWRDFVHPEDRAASIQAGESLAQGNPLARFENRFRTKDGSYRWLAWNAVSNAASETIYASARDVTLERQLAEQLRQSQKLEAVGRLAGGVAHDFNNLLTVINGYAELILDRLSSADTLWEPLSAIRSSGEKAAELTAQLLAFSRKSIVAPKQIDVNQAIESAAHMLRRLIGEDISLTTELAPTFKVNIDPGLFDQVLVNLVVNARDAMPRGGRITFKTSSVKSPFTSLVESAANRTGNYVELVVSDTGEGMNAEVLSQVFEPFFTTKEVGKGTGLGLAMVYGIIQQAGGNITVDSAIGRGSAFRILLPAAQHTDDANDKIQADRAPRGSETILLVEDEVAVRKLARKSLESLGYRVLEAGTGAEAVQIAETCNGSIDLLLTDVVMPIVSGRDVADRIKKTRESLPVLYMSGFMDDAVVRHGVEISSDAYLQKPFTQAALARKVRELLDKAPR